MRYKNERKTDSGICQKRIQNARKGKRIVAFTHKNKQKQKGSQLRLTYLKCTQCVHIIRCRRQQPYLF